MNHRPGAPASSRPGTDVACYSFPRLLSCLVMPWNGSPPAFFLPLLLSQARPSVVSIAAGQCSATGCHARLADRRWSRWALGDQGILPIAQCRSGEIPLAASPPGTLYLTAVVWDVRIVAPARISLVAARATLNTQPSCSGRYIQTYLCVYSVRGEGWGLCLPFLDPTTAFLQRARRCVENWPGLSRRPAVRGLAGS